MCCLTEQTRLPCDGGDGLSCFAGAAKKLVGHRTGPLSSTHQPMSGADRLSRRSGPCSSYLGSGREPSCLFAIDQMPFGHWPGHRIEGLCPGIESPV